MIVEGSCVLFFSCWLMCTPVLAQSFGPQLLGISGGATAVTGESADSNGADRRVSNRPMKGTAGKSGKKLPAVVPDKPKEHWFFEAGDKTWEAKSFAPSKDGAGFRYPNHCYGHVLMAIRWFQFITRPILTGTVTEITSDEFRDFWGRKLDYNPTYSITKNNIEKERLYPYSIHDEKSRVAIAKYIGILFPFQNKSAYKDQKDFDHPKEFCTAVVNTLHDAGIPTEVGMYAQKGGAHSMTVYRVVRGTAMMGNTDGKKGERKEAYRLYFYDSLDTPPPASDEKKAKAYEDNHSWLVFEDGDGFIGFSEYMEYSWSEYLIQTDTPGTWKLPIGRVEVFRNPHKTGSELAKLGKWLVAPEIKDDHMEYIMGRK
jgi:hypothetical protein